MDSRDLGFDGVKCELWSNGVEFEKWIIDWLEWFDRNALDEANVEFDMGR